MGGLELQHYNGPWDSPDNQRKINAVLRYSSGDPDDGYSLTAMYYGGLWNATTDQPVRAITQGLIGRFGSLDPTDGGPAQRYSLSGQYRGALGPGALEAHAYVIGNRLTLWNDFTHSSPTQAHRDPEPQTENRVTLGGGASLCVSIRSGAFPMIFWPVSTRGMTAIMFSAICPGPPVPGHGGRRSGQ